MIFQESGITFNNVKKIGTKISSFPLGNPDNYLYDGNSASRKDTEHIDYKGGIINAIDIDWNGVNTESIPEEYVLVLNTTSDVLKWIKKLEYRISILENNGSHPDNPEYYINWDGNGATTSAYPSQTSVLSGNSVILPTTNPKREYTITWNANGGSGTISGGTTKVTYTFNNWWTARVGGDQVTSNTKPIRDTTYYAHWINPSGITLPTTNPTRNGYNFMGWATTSSATTPNVTSSTIPTGDVTYYAVWLIQSVTLSSIEWESTTATSVLGSNPNWPRIRCRYSDNTTPYIYVNTSGVTTSESITSSTAAGTYYNITASYQGKTTTNSLTYTVTARPVTLYNVTFNGNGGTISGNTTRTVNAGDPIGTFPSVTYSGHELTKWTYSDGNTANSTDIVNKNITIYAQWLNIYTIEFIDRGINLKTIKGPTGTQVTKPSNPSRSGYTFEGWNENESAGVGGQVITKIGTRDVTYYAQWKEVTPVVTQYTVTYHPNGGNSTPEPQTVNAGETVTLAGAITRNADSSYTYEFSHWNTTSDNKGTSYDAGETIPVDDNIDLYAQWNKIPITPVTTTYYWYAGQTQPISMNGTPTVDDINFTNNKWHTIGTTLTNINKTSTGGTSGNPWYVAVPKDKYKPTASDFVTPNTSWEIINTINVGSIQYSVYNTNTETARCAAILAVK